MRLSAMLTVLLWASVAIGETDIQWAHPDTLWDWEAEIDGGGLVTVDVKWIRGGGGDVVYGGNLGGPLPPSYRYRLRALGPEAVGTWSAWSEWRGWACDWDLNHDGAVNTTDIGQIANETLGQSCGP